MSARRFPPWFSEQLSSVVVNAIIFTCRRTRTHEDGDDQYYYVWSYANKSARTYADRHVNKKVLTDDHEIRLLVFGSSTIFQSLARNAGTLPFISNVVCILTSGVKSSPWTNTLRISIRITKTVLTSSATTIAMAERWRCYSAAQARASGVGGILRSEMNSDANAIGPCVRF